MSMSIRIRLSATLILLGLSLNCVRALADEIPQKIDTTEAQDLTYEVTKKHNPDKGSLEYSGLSRHERFFTFQGLGPVAGSYGFFAVNPWTGDVWALSTLAERISELSSNAVRRVGRTPWH